MRPLFFLLLFCCAALGPLSAEEHPDYNAPLSDAEKANIRFIIMTLSQKSGIALLFEKGALERAGDGVRNVHPLRFFCYVFTDPELRSAISHIHGIAWNRFSKEMGESLATEAEERNLGAEMLSDFAKQVGIQEPKIEDTSAQSFQHFIETTREEIAASAIHE